MNKFNFTSNKKKFFMGWALKLTVLAVAFLFIVPSSMMLSDYIYEVNKVSVEETETIVESTENASEEGKDAPWYKQLWDGITDVVKKTVDQMLEEGKNALNKFVDEVSVFVIAYCAIPVFVVFLFLWLFKYLFGLNINVDVEALKPKQIKGKKKDEIEVSV